MHGRRSSMNGDKRLIVNPFAGIGLLDPKLDRRRIARPLTERSRHEKTPGDAKSIGVFGFQEEWLGPGLNRRHLHFQCSALPTELPNQPQRRFVPGERTKNHRMAGIVEGRAEECQSEALRFFDRTPIFIAPAPDVPMVRMAPSSPIVAFRSAKVAHVTLLSRSERRLLYYCVGMSSAGARNETSRGYCRS